MGNVQAISNLGYCYLYGRDIEQNTDLAIAYFKIAAGQNNVDSAYKLGDIYSKDKYVKKDHELSIYYYRMALTFILGEDEYSSFWIMSNEELGDYPSLCFALGRELLKGDHMPKDIERSRLFLKRAKKAYEREIKNGVPYYDECLKSCDELLTESIFDQYKNEEDELLNDFEDNKEKLNRFTYNNGYIPYKKENAELLREKLRKAGISEEEIEEFISKMPDKEEDITDTDNN